VDNIKSEKQNNYNSERKYTKQIAIVKKKIENLKATSNPSTPNAKSKIASSE